MRENQAHNAPAPLRENHRPHKASSDEADEPDAGHREMDHPVPLTSPIPGGVPDGKPSDGWAGKSPRRHHRAVGPEQTQHPRRLPSQEAPRTPTAAAIVSCPVARKVAI